jgi:hypothetical protein
VYFVSFVVDEFRTLPNPESSPWPRQIATCRTSPAYWEQNVYYAGINGSLDRYSITSGLLSSKPVSKSTETFPYPGATPSISSNGASDGIVWVLENARGPAILRAYDPIDLSKELYDSNQAGSRDKPPW